MKNFIKEHIFKIGDRVMTVFGNIEFDIEYYVKDMDGKTIYASKSYPKGEYASRLKLIFNSPTRLSCEVK
jgi:hypothetical protein